MSEYILFIDTETSDKPKKWNEPTYHIDKWPYILQVAWSVHTKDGKEVAVRNFYIDAGDIVIDERALDIHGITLDYLKQNGITREEVLQQLSKDLLQYQPLVVGHFLQFDLKMLEVGFNRAKINHNLRVLPKFCTMLNTRFYFTPGGKSMLRLEELYRELFKQELHNQHNALEDAKATRECFFEQVRRGGIDQQTIHNQQKYYRERTGIKEFIAKMIS